MKKTVFIILSCIFMLTTIVGCTANKQLLETKISYEEIDKIQIITAMGNPAYGADSKIIIDANEIKAFVDTFNIATIGKKVDDSDVGVTIASYYYFYSDDTLVAEFAFNGNDTNKIWYNESYYYIDYAERADTPFVLYKNSKADIFVVDEKGCKY